MTIGARTRDRVLTFGGAAQPRGARDGWREHKPDILRSLVFTPSVSHTPGRFAAGAERFIGQSAYIRVICG